MGNGIQDGIASHNVSLDLHNEVCVEGSLPSLLETALSITRIYFWRDYFSPFLLCDLINVMVTKEFPDIFGLYLLKRHFLAGDGK